MKQNKQTIRLTESKLRQVIKEGIRNILSETNDLPDVTDDDREYVDSLHLNQNIPHEGWFRDEDGLYKIGPDGEKYHDKYGSLKYMPYVDKSGKRHERHVSTSDTFNDPINDDDYTKQLYMRYAHGNGKFLRNGTGQLDPAANYVRTGKAMTKNDLWGYYDTEGDVDKDMSDLNKKIKRQNDNNLKRSLSAADKRPLHSKNSLNRIGMKMNESQLRQVVKNVIMERLCKEMDNDQIYNYIDNYFAEHGLPAKVNKQYSDNDSIQLLVEKARYYKIHDIIDAMECCGYEFQSYRPQDEFNDIDLIPVMFFKRD